VFIGNVTSNSSLLNQGIYFYSIL